MPMHQITEWLKSLVIPREVTVKPLSEGETIYTQEFETTQFKAQLTSESSIFRRLNWYTY